MALSNGKGYSKTPLIFLSPRSQKLVDGKKVNVDPHFEISRVGEDDKIKNTGETCTDVSGTLTKIELKDREFNGAINKHAILYIRGKSDEGAEETYYLDLSYRISSRSLFNALLSLTSPDNLSIGIYESKKGYETFALRQGDVMIKWKHDLAELPKTVDILDTKGKLVKRDSSDLDEFFETGLRELSVRLFGAPKEKAAAPAPVETKAPAAAKTQPAPKAAPVAASDDASVPF